MTKTLSDNTQEKTYQESQRKHQTLLIYRSPLFDGTRNGGDFGDLLNRCYVLENGKGKMNLYRSIRESAVEYFAVNNIKWWGAPGDEKREIPTEHLLSSQVACLNHLFPLREDATAVLEVARTVCPDAVEVLPVTCDKGNTAAYIAFEVVSKNDHLNEGCSTRGEWCTSIDAVILARTRDERNVLLAIEWKYTESYPDKDMSIEDKDHEPKGNMGKGRKRQQRYNDMITASPQLKTLTEYQRSVYYQEPFYQLMRQTLWAEQMVANKTTETIKADDYIHVHVVPQANHELLDRQYGHFGTGMRNVWTSMLKHPEKYKLIDPSALCASIEKSDPRLYDYLKQRYWQ